MPIFGQWITATGDTSSTAQTWAVPVYTAATNVTSSTATTAQFYLAMAANQTAATAASTVYWYTEQQPEDWVDHQQYLALAQGRVTAFRVRTEAQRMELELQQRLAEERAVRYSEERKVALDRSRELLLAHLTAAQQKTFEKNKWFVVEGGKTKRLYRIRTETYAGNIDVLDEGFVRHRLCVHCVANIPLHDHHLAQKLSLQYDEEYFLSIANRQAA